MAVQKIEIDLSGPQPHIIVTSEEEPASAQAIILAFLDSIDARKLDYEACNVDYSVPPVQAALQALRRIAGGGEQLEVPEEEDDDARP